MPPNSTQNFDTKPDVVDKQLPKLVAPQAGLLEYNIMWVRVLFFTFLHIDGLYGLYWTIYAASWSTVLFNFFLLLMSGLSTTAGNHRLWTHRCYKATKPLQVFFMLGHCVGGMDTIFIWTKLHRLHHQYSDTDADPHNATRGFLFSHVGWLCVHGHPEMKKRIKLVDMSDIYANPIIMFQKRNLVWLNFGLAFFLPTLIPMYFWNEPLSVSYHVTMFRFMFAYTVTAFVNSLAHLFGSRPYDKNISPKQNAFVSFFSFGEGFHNYHHAFPHDYKAGELGSFMNFTTTFLDFCAKLGLAYDFKEASSEAIKQRVARTGDGSGDKHGLSVVANILT